MLKKLFHNWPLKLLAVILSVVVWFIIMSQADPTDTKTIYNIPVRLINTDLLKQANKSYSIEGGDTPTVNARVSASGSVLRELSASDFTATADVEKMMDLTGQVPVTLTCTHPSISDSQVTLLNNSIKINYDDITVKYFTVQISSRNEPAEGYFIGEMRANPRTVRINGPSKVVALIGSVVAEVDVQGLTESTEITTQLQYYTDTNQLMLLDNYKDTNASVSDVKVSVDVLTKKSVPIIISQEALDEAKDSLPDGYRFTGSSLSIQSVEVRGLRSRLAELSLLSIPAGILNMKGATENRTFQVDLVSLLPDGVSLMDEQPESVLITLNVDALSVHEFETDNIRITGKSGAFRYTADETVLVYIRALEEDFVGFDISSVIVNVDLGEYAYKEGIWELPVTVECSDSIFTPLSDRSHIMVKVEKIVVPTVPPTTAAPRRSGETTEPSKDDAVDDVAYPAGSTLPEGAQSDAGVVSQVPVAAATLPAGERRWGCGSLFSV